MAAPVILVEAKPRRPADGAIEDVRLAGQGAIKPYRYPDAAGGAVRSWRAGIASLPTIICSLTFDGTDLGAGGVAQAAEISWKPARSGDLDAMAAYFWFDAAIAVRIGPEGISPPIALAGKVLGASAADGELKLALADPAAALKKPFPLDRYAGTGDLEGPADWAGRLKDRVWGRIWNKAGEPIDTAHNIYAFADPARPLQAIDAVRDRGAAAAALTTLNWQGSIGATLIALRAAEAPQGGGICCPSIACVKWWTQPAGSLCADLRGEVGSGYVETSAAIAAALVAAQAGLPFTAGTIASAVAARPAPVGWLIDDETTAVSAMLDQLLGNVSLLWVLSPAGEIVIRQWAWGASVASARSEKVSRLEQFRPVHTRKIGYRRNELPMARGDIAAIVFATDIAFADGTPIEDLKPAEGGATVGAPAGTPVGDREAQELADQVESIADALPPLAARTDVLETETIPAIDAAVTAARARADAAFDEIESEAGRLDQRIDSVSAEGGYDDTAIFAAVTQVDQAAISRDMAAAQRATDIETAVDAAEARIMETETAVSDGRFATAVRASDIEAAVDAAEARITQTETAVSDGRFATAQRVDTLEAEVDGTAASVSQQAGVIAGLGVRTAAYVKTLAVAGNNRAQLTLYADANAGAGVDIVGDVGISGDLTVNGSLRIGKLDRTTMTAYTQGQVSGLYGSFNAGTVYVPNLGASMAVRAGGTFFFSFSGYSGNTNAGVTANYNSLELLDEFGGVLASIKLPYGTLTSHIVILPNQWGERIVQWRVATRSQPGSGSNATVGDLNVSLNWSML